jgi:hypothetical protein
LSPVIFGSAGFADGVTTAMESAPGRWLPRRNRTT